MSEDSVSTNPGARRVRHPPEIAQADSFGTVRRAAAAPGRGLPEGESILELPDVTVTGNLPSLDGEILDLNLDGTFVDPPARDGVVAHEESRALTLSGDSDRGSSGDVVATFGSRGREPLEAFSETPLARPALRTDPAGAPSAPPAGPESAGASDAPTARDRVPVPDHRGVEATLAFGVSPAVRRAAITQEPAAIGERLATSAEHEAHGRSDASPPGSVREPRSPAEPMVAPPATPDLRVTNANMRSGTDPDTVAGNAFRRLPDADGDTIATRERAEPNAAPRATVNPDRLPPGLPGVYFEPSAERSGLLRMAVAAALIIGLCVVALYLFVIREMVFPSAPARVVAPASIPRAPQSVPSPVAESTQPETSVPETSRQAIEEAAATADAPRRPAPVDGTSAAGGYTLQVASTQDEHASGAIAAELESADFDAYVVRADLGARGVWFRVRVGRFASADEARSVAARLRTTGRAASPMVTSFEPKE